MLSRNFFTKLLWISAVSIFLLLSACGGSKEDNNDEEGEENGEETVTENLKKVLTDVPEPSEIPYQIQATGAEFDSELPNLPSMVEKYKTTSNKAALNLGVFATDIGYVSVYSKVQNAIDYIKAVKDLGDKLGISNAFDPKLQDRFESNLQQVDSLTAIINEALEDSDTYLKEQEQESIAALVFAGSFVEGIYVATQLVENYPNDLLPEDAKVEILIPVIKLILQQKETLKDLLKALNSLSIEDDAVKKMVKDLEELSKMYDELDIDKKIEENKGGLILGDEVLKGISKKIKTIREDIIS